MSLMIFKNMVEQVKYHECFAWGLHFLIEVLKYLVISISSYI